ncbi:MAG: hypothetical protein COB59_03445 [Rhodospirillaceae bacterium]|nr:MAG: hypothetical protein COB59_03445 [Rhodospirillaceae bacterium]
MPQGGPLHLSENLKYSILKFMDLSRFHPTRRQIIRTLLQGMGMSPAVLAVLKNASANSKVPIIPGVQKIVGDVRLNGISAQVGQLVHPGDVCTTGADSECIIIIGEHAFLLRERAEIEFYSEYFEEGLNTSLSGRIRIAAGALLAVFGNTDTTLSTPLATIGIRGTACYVEVGLEKDYVCLCYGRAELRSKLNPAVGEDLDTFHHDAPRNFYANPAEHNGLFIEPEEMINHIDEELILLESLVGRIPLFGPEPIKMPGNPIPKQK